MTKDRDNRVLIKRGALLSGLLHLAVAILLGISLYSSFSSLSDHKVIPVELLEVDTETRLLSKQKNLTPAPKEDKKEQDKEVRAKDKETKPFTPSAAPPEAEKKGIMPPSEIKEELRPETKPQDLPKVTEKEPSPPVTKPQQVLKEATRTPEKNPHTSSVDHLLKDVLNTNPHPSPVKEKEESTKQKSQATSPPQDDMTPKSGLTISEKDVIRRQLRECWNIQAGGRDAHALIVKVKISVNPDATVRSVEVVEQERMAKDPAFRIAAENAVRAVLHPKCRQLKFPLAKYDTWKIFIFKFDPSEILGASN